MKKGLFILIGIFVLSILSINFIAAICLGSNTASCTISSCFSPACTSVDNSYCTEAEVPSGIGDCSDYLLEDCEVYECEWVPLLSCYKTNCGGIAGETSCDSVPGCNWVDGSGQFAIADADQAISGYGDSTVCRPSVDISANLGTTSEFTSGDLWYDTLYVHYTSGSTNLGILKYDTSTLALPFIDYPTQSIWDDEIIIGEPATSGSGSTKPFFRLTEAIKYPNHLSWINNQGYVPFIHVSHDDFNNFCTANNQIIYYYAYMYIEDTYYAYQDDPLFVMYADDDAWVNIYAYSPDGRAAGMEGTGQLKNKYSCFSDWSESFYDDPNGMAYCNSGYWQGWYVIEIALQEDGGDQELFVGVKRDHNFAEHIGYLGWDMSEVYETCDRLAGVNFDRTDCDDYGAYAACINSGYDSYEAECCGDDGASDIGVVNGNKRCTQCTVTVSGVGNIGDYVWVPSLDGDNDGVDDDCDGQTDEDGSCPPNPNECIDQGKTCGEATDNCGVDYTCGPSCPTVDCPTCQSSGGIWCENVQGTTNDICADTIPDCFFDGGTIMQFCPPPAGNCDGKVCGPNGVGGTCEPGCPAPTCVDDDTLSAPTCNAAGRCDSNNVDCPLGEICAGGECITIGELDNCERCQSYGGGWCEDSNHPNVDFCAYDDFECNVASGTIVGTCTSTDNCQDCVNSGGAWCLDPGDNRCINFPPPPTETCNIFTPIIDNCPVIPSGTPNAFWSLDGFSSLSTSDSDGNRLVRDTPFPIQMVIEDSGLPQGIAIFEVFEKDLGTDDNIRIGPDGIGGTVDSNGKAVAEWQITFSDIENSASDDGDQDYEFYFIADYDNDLESENLYFEAGIEAPTPCDEISRCFDYAEEQCEPNQCGVAEASVADKDDSITCGDGYDCECFWYGAAEGCGPIWDGLDSGGETMGTCTYNEDLSQDNCDDGWLTYSWTALWTPNSGYSGGEDLSEKAAKCKEGDNSVICPAQIELPFFGTWGILVTIGLIILIYVALNLKSHKPEKRKK